MVKKQLDISLLRKYGIPIASLSFDILAGSVNAKSILTAGAVIITFCEDIDSIKIDEIAENCEIDGDNNYIQAIKTLNQDGDKTKLMISEVRTLLNSATGSYYRVRNNLEEQWLFFDVEKYAVVSNKLIICLVERAYCSFLLDELKTCNLYLLEAREVFYQYIKLILKKIFKRENVEAYIYEGNIKYTFAFDLDDVDFDITTSAKYILLKEIEEQERLLLKIFKNVNMDSWDLIYTISKDYKKASAIIPSAGRYHKRINLEIAVYKYK